MKMIKIYLKNVSAKSPRLHPKNYLFFGDPSWQTSMILWQILPLFYLWIPLSALFFGGGSETARGEALLVELARLDRADSDFPESCWSLEPVEWSVALRLSFDAGAGTIWVPLFFFDDECLEEWEESMELMLRDSCCNNRFWSTGLG